MRIRESGMEKIRIWDGKKSDPESGINIPDPQHCLLSHPSHLKHNYELPSKIHLRVSDIIRKIWKPFSKAKADALCQKRVNTILAFPRERAKQVPTIQVFFIFLYQVEKEVVPHADDNRIGPCRMQQQRGSRDHQYQ
jgi:hypothetical protein